MNGSPSVESRPPSVFGISSLWSDASHRAHPGQTSARRSPGPHDGDPAPHYAFRAPSRNGETRQATVAALWSIDKMPPDGESLGCPASPLCGQPITAEDAEKAGSLNNARGPMMKPRTTPDGTQTQASGLSSAPYPSPHNSARSAVETACRSQRGTAETPRAGTRSEIRRVNSTPIPDGLRVDAERHSVPRSLPARSGYRWSATSSVSRRCGSDNTSPAISRIFVKRYRSVL